MNWNNVLKLKFRVYDPELKQFITDFDFPRLLEGFTDIKDKPVKARYHTCYNEHGLILGFYQQNGDWNECILFMASGFRDNLGNELYMYDKIQHTDDNLNGFKGVIDIEQGRWVIRYDSDRTAPLADRCEFIKFVGLPDTD